MWKNEQSFDAVCTRLASGAAVLIFPEGVSLGTRTLEPMRSGAARIALQAEAQKSPALGLSIQAAGLIYSDMPVFGSQVTVHLGEPFELTEYSALYHDPTPFLSNSLLSALKTKSALHLLTFKMQNILS